jgi:ABC-2 type transport system ATP-binding protein
VLFLDEPTVGLDPLARQAVWDHLKQLRDESGTTIILTTHYMDEAETLCRRVAIMHRGRVMALGAPRDLEAAIGGKDTTLDDVFVQVAGGPSESGGSYRETTQERRMARRLG